MVGRATLGTGEAVPDGATAGELGTDCVALPPRETAVVDGSAPCPLAAATVDRGIEQFRRRDLAFVHQRRQRQRVVVLVIRHAVCPSRGQRAAGIAGVDDRSGVTLLANPGHSSEPMCSQPLWMRRRTRPFCS